MKIELINSPQIVAPTSGKVSGRDAAISKFMENSQQTPVSNPTQVSPEEMTALQPSGQSDIPSNSTESTAQEAKPAEPKQVVDPLSTQYAQLARKEKALRAKAQQQELALKAKAAEITAKEEALKAKEAEYQSNYIQKSRLKQDPLSVLTEEGVSYDEITKAILNPQGQQDPRVMVEIERLKAEVEQTKKFQEQAKKDYENNQKASYDQAVAQIRNETKQLVKNDPAFEAIKATNSINDVVELIERVYNKDGILLSVEEAAQEVESYLVDKLASYSQIKKIQSKLQSSKSTATVQKQSTEPSQKQQQSQGVKTLTNSVNASKKLSARERAVAAFKGEKL